MNWLVFTSIFRKKILTNKILKWKSRLSFVDSINITILWYKKFYEKKTNMYKFSLFQLESFLGKK